MDIEKEIVKLMYSTSNETKGKISRDGRRTEKNRLNYVAHSENYVNVINFCITINFCIAKKLFPVTAVFPSPPPPLVTDASRSAGAAPNAAENDKAILVERDDSKTIPGMRVSGARSCCILRYDEFDL